MKKQEIERILHSKDEEYAQKRKNIRLFKTRTILMIACFFFLISGVNWLYVRLPDTAIQALVNLHTDERTAKIAQLVSASKVTLVIAGLLFFSKPVSALLIGLKNLLSIIVALIQMFGRRIKKLEKFKKEEESCKIEYGSASGENQITSKERAYMAQLMKEQLEFGLSKYGLLFSVEAPKKGIEISEVVKGPTITRYWVNPNDVLVKEINSKLDDIALAMGVQSVSMTQERGKLYLEVPNLPEAREKVYFKHIYDEFCKKKRHPLEIPIGVTASGEVLTVAINKCPHMLIAGATGSGKSVCLNVVLNSIILNATPKEVRMILADPKRVELSAYEGIPHLKMPIAKTIEEIILALEYSVKEMERRYELLAEARVKNIEAYHEKGYELPYLLVVVDEVASAMVQNASTVEECVMRLSAEARAAGIHLILATQRPSVDVITGVIKANLPSAIAFATKSNADSRVILDQSGAEKLLGSGDGLLMLPDRANLTRFQGAFLRDEEIDIIIETAKKQYGSANNLNAWEKQTQSETSESAEYTEVRDETVETKESERVKTVKEEIDDNTREEVIEKTDVFKDIEENVDAQLLSFICKEKIKGESVLPSTSEIVDLLKRRKSVILESINHLIDNGHIKRDGGGKYITIQILLSRDDAIRYLFHNDLESYEEIQDEILKNKAE